MHHTPRTAHCTSDVPATEGHGLQEGGAGQSAPPGGLRTYTLSWWGGGSLTKRAPSAALYPFFFFRSCRGCTFQPARVLHCLHFPLCVIPDLWRTQTIAVRAAPRPGHAAQCRSVIRPGLAHPTLDVPSERGQPLRLRRQPRGSLPLLAVVAGSCQRSNVTIDNGRLGTSLSVGQQPHHAIHRGGLLVQPQIYMFVLEGDEMHRNMA